MAMGADLQTLDQTRVTITRDDATCTCRITVDIPDRRLLDAPEPDVLRKIVERLVDPANYAPPAPDLRGRCFAPEVLQAFADELAKPRPGTFSRPHYAPIAAAARSPTPREARLEADLAIAEGVLAERTDQVNLLRERHFKLSAANGHLERKVRESIPPDAVLGKVTPAPGDVLTLVLPHEVTDATARSMLRALSERLTECGIKVPVVVMRPGMSVRPVPARLFRARVVNPEGMAACDLAYREAAAASFGCTPDQIAQARAAGRKPASVWRA